MENIEKIASICKVLSDNKAEDIKIIDSSKTSNLVNFFIIATATSITHVKSLIDFCYEEVTNQHLFDIKFRELYNTSKWQVLDVTDGFIHVFTKEERDKYSLERLLSENGNTLTYNKLLKIISKKIDNEKKIVKKKIISNKKMDKTKKKSTNKELTKTEKAKK